MPVLVVITRPPEALPLIHLGVACALARESSLIVVHPAQRGEKSAADDVTELPLLGDKPTDPVDAAAVEAAHQTIRDRLAPGGGEPDHPEASARAAIGCPVITVLRAEGRAPAAAVLDLVKQRGVGLLLAAQHEKGDAQTAEFSLPNQMFRRCPCEVMVVRPGANAGQAPTSILVPTAGGPHASAALRLARAMADDAGASVDALFVEPPVGGDAPDVGLMILNKHIAKALGPKAEAVGRRVVVAKDFRKGIAEAAERGYDLILVGASEQLALRRVLFSAVPNQLVTQAGRSGTSVAVMRRAIPVSAKLVGAGRRLLERGVPQLDREARLSLVERVQGNSRWDFDFIALIALSTLIATLGLIISSPAVVIGAMLIAPLMTPLIGAGLALVQGNAVLVRHAAQAVGYGFVLAYLIGTMLGVVIPEVELSPEILSRTKPNLLDLMVAFVSGVAAAYATARPNLSGALPGVAIAAALVPPIGASGVCLALGKPTLAFGAGLLFVTNIVAIVLGAAMVLFAVGIRTTHTHGRSKPWVRRGYIGLIIAAAILTIPLSRLVHERLNELPARVHALVKAHVEAQPHTRFVRMEHLIHDYGLAVRIHITAPQPADQRMALELSDLLTEQMDQRVRVRVLTELSSDSHPAAPIGED